MSGPQLEAYGRWVFRNRAQLTTLVLGLTVLAIWAIVNRIQSDSVVDFTPQAMFMGEGGEWDRLQAYEAEFGADDNTVVALLEGDIGSAAGLKWLQSLHASVEGAPGVVTVRSLSNASIATATPDGMIDVVAAIDPDGSITQAAGDPFLSPLLIARDQTAATIQIELADDLQQIGDLSPVVHDITARLHGVSTPPDFTLHVTGVPFVRTEVVDMMISDEMTFMPLVTLVFLITILILFRRLWLGLAPLVGVLFATIWAVGLLLSQGAVFNILSILAPTLILVIGVADGIHLVNRYREELASDGSREAAMGRTIRHLSLACFLTTFTTAAGFVSLTVADTAVIRDFGQQVAVGVMVTFFALMMVVPTLLAWIPVSKVGRPEDVLEHAIYDKLANLVSTRPKRILFVTLSLTLFAGWLGRDVTTDSALLEMYHEDHPTWTAVVTCLLYTSPSPRDKRQSRMPSSA